MSDRDDWFERALQGPDGGDAESDGDEPDDSGWDEPDEAENGAAVEEPADGGGGSEDDGGLFDDDFASALGETSGPDGGGGFGDAGGFGDGEFGGGGGGGDPFGGGEMGFGGGGADEDLSEESFESELSRIDLGIDGLDDMIRGGVPDRSLMTVIGSAGTGKTTFGLQFLHRGLGNDERAVYVTLEESKARIIDSATEKGWPFDEYVESGDLAIVDIDPIEMANSLTSIRSELPRLIEEFGARRLVLDSVSLLELMYEDRAKRRNEVYEFTRTLKESGVTTLLTSEASDDNPYASRHGIVEYLTDAVFIMRYVRPSDFRETRLAIEIQKIRDANHAREMKPYEITDEGLNVYRQANIF